ncbi:hypothetical protein [Dickeya oryzae]|uniref:hypothetical protein n=1 Tax=Dickeya oryzae TaxID=1240404 RepID=UPI001AEC820D|nr:hypothetical protein [Dickeya oryzae]MBP2847889.1 hypothetical protein [Dickeya oryzae]
MSDQHRLTTPDYIGLHRTAPLYTELHRCSTNAFTSWHPRYARIWRAMALCLAVST